jgi:hypothetical protein
VAEIRAALDQGRDRDAAARLEGSAYAIDASVATYAAAYEGTPLTAGKPQACAALPA